ncbi:putative Ig domain-containing protein [Myxococcus landrumensis]|uniref:Ig domain-containing protein n=1 Tax=Myxococcus landrumensis TaxID=2813577 RepID=A0ABX7N2L3_9BACT|nr:putative Ig domain-containing protein [Myxococcus landrumus]QSQ12733.1 putative Ig domain-containing protein [Myxococcus landrumus]
MSTIIRAAAIVVVLSLLSACSGSNHEDPSGGPKLPTAELVDTTVGADYEVRLTATGGTAPYFYSMTEEPPPGFSFYSADGKLTGPATASGQYAVKVTVRDAEKTQDTRAYNLKVWPSPVLSSVVPPNALTGSNYSHLFSITGGRPPLTFSVTQGSLPAGLTLSEEGELSGVARQTGTSIFTVRAQDASGVQVEARFAMEVKQGTGTPDSGPNPSGSFPLAVGNWNIEWFGDPGAGPTDDTLQRNNVATVINGADVDVWGLAEVVSTTEFNTLKGQLPGYDGFLANDARVTSGSSYYDTSEQKVGILYKTGVVEVLQSQLILTQYNFDFATRPPLRVDLRIKRGTATADMTLVVLHMKAMSASADYDRRRAAGQWLKTYLDTNLPTQRVMVVGDWNDDLDTSIVSGYDTPYRNFLNDTARYGFITHSLTLSGASSTVSYRNFIDHQLASNEMRAHYVSNSASVLRPALTNYGTNTSDHYPIVSRYDLAQVAPPAFAPTSSDSIDAFQAPGTGWPQGEAAGFTIH